MNTGFIFRTLIAWLPGVLLLSGCMTSNTIDAIKHPVSKPVHDFVDRVERASITESNILLIFVEARLTNSPHRGQYTMIVPLRGVRAERISIPPHLTNGVIGSYHLKRDGIVPGWDASKSPQSKTVPIGPRVDYSPDDWPKRCRALPGRDCTLFPVDELITVGLGPTEPVPYKFVYVDATHPELSTKISVEEVRTVPEGKDKYWVLPFAVIGDVATLPFQILCFAVYFASGGH